MRRNRVIGPLVASFALILSLMIILIHTAPSPVEAQSNLTPTASTQCSRTVQNFFEILQKEYDFQPQTPRGIFNYCVRLENELNVYSEAKLGKSFGGSGEGIPGQSLLAYAFIDFAARQYVGDLPRGEKFMAVARNALPNSRMMFVYGDNFAVFVDYGFTTISEADFATLPDFREYQGDAEPNCRASWCRAPGPKPTQSK